MKGLRTGCSDVMYVFMMAGLYISQLWRSRGNMLALKSKFAGSNLAEVTGCFYDVKILSTRFSLKNLDREKPRSKI